MLILASGSPRRKELLSQIGLQFEIMVCKGEEKPKASDPWMIVQELSMQKAREIAKRITDLNQSTLILAADTIVAKENEIMGKPKSDEDAYRMLTSLAGATHQVYTGVTILYKEQDSIVEYTFYEKTDVEMYKMTPEQIRSYIETKEPVDKAGAYAIQGRCGAFIKAIRGEYANVVGLPIGRLYQELCERNLLNRVECQ